MREDNVITAIFLVKKKDEKGQYTKWRLVQNFKPVNEGLTTNPLIMPEMEQEINKLKGARYFTILDLKSAFWQIPLLKEDRPFTCFRVPGMGLYRWTVWPMGVKTAPACCVQMTREILRGMEEYSAPYMDDLIVFSETAREHAVHVRDVLEAMSRARGRLNWMKLKVFKTTAIFLGMKISHDIVELSETTKKQIDSYEEPKTIRKLQSFLGFTNYCAPFIRDYNQLVEPFTDLLKNQQKTMSKRVGHRGLDWKKQHADAFVKLKEAVKNTMKLVIPDFNKEFTLETDASDVGVGAVLVQQNNDGIMKPVRFISRKLTTIERSYCTREKEALAIKWAIKKLRNYLWKAFTVITDHRSLEWLMKSDEPDGMLGRWALRLSEYDFKIVWRPGRAEYRGRLSIETICYNDI